eukprot:gene22523-1336_t
MSPMEAFLIGGLDVPSFVLALFVYQIINILFGGLLYRAYFRSWRHSETYSALCQRRVVRTIVNVVILVTLSGFVVLAIIIFLAAIPCRSNVELRDGCSDSVDYIIPLYESVMLIQVAFSLSLVYENAPRSL